MKLASQITTISEQIEREIRIVRREEPFPAVLIRALVAAEDRRFFRHHGIDAASVLRALWKYVTGGTISGASTIEQQLVRTLRGRYEITLRRKLSEMLIAIIISRKFDKNSLAHLYCKVAYLGWHARGMRQAAARLKLELSSLSDRDAATLAAMLKLPMPRYPSVRYNERLMQRVDYIVQRMEQNGWIR